MVSYLSFSGCFKGPNLFLRKLYGEELETTVASHWFPVQGCLTVNFVPKKGIPYDGFLKGSFFGYKNTLAKEQGEKLNLISSGCSC